MATQYSDVTPAETLLDGTLDGNIFRSPFANLRWNVVPDRVIIIDSKYEANLPGLAFDYYGDMDLWRCILAFNGLIDPIQDIQVGVRIGLPSRQSIEEYLASQAGTSTVELQL